MDASRLELDHGATLIQQTLFDKRRRLGTALQQLATELAHERRRAAALERELARMRADSPPERFRRAP
jgi:hypothetical protein